MRCFPGAFAQDPSRSRYTPARSATGGARDLSRYERWNELLDSLAQSDRLTVEEAAEHLGVSRATIRRDFDELARQQMLTRIRGGARRNSVAYDLPLRYKTARHASEKERIGVTAAALIPAGGTVALNGGTTTTEVARAIATRGDLDGSPGEPTMTVVTNALNIANELAVRPHVKIVLTGGVARRQSYELIGPLATLVLETLTVDYAILGVDGLDGALGATAHHEGEASISQLMARRADHVMIVADGSKLGGRGFARICDAGDVHTLVTDSSAPASELERLRERGVRVVIA
jgi:DeoR family transcriptional regulator, aga operon transcriptional repressor